MREPIVFNFVPDQRPEAEPTGQRAPQDKGDRRPDDRSFEPTRDGWRAYQAWCKQVREHWESEK